MVPTCFFLYQIVFFIFKTLFVVIREPLLIKIYHYIYCINFFIVKFLEIAKGTSSVWADISAHLNYKMAASALHTMVHKGRYGIKETLGISTDISNNDKTLPISTENNLTYQSGKKNSNYKIILYTT